jgi:microcystin-dependent protein
MSYLATFVAAVLATLGGYGLINQTPAPEPSVGAAVQPIAGVTYNLAGSGVSGSATSLTLASLTIPQTGQKIQDSDLSDTFYLTIEPGNRTRQEIVSCTTVAQNANGTATLSGCSRGLSPITPYTASSTLAFAHAGGSQVIFSDPPQLFNLYPAKANTESITGLYTFASTSWPKIDVGDADPTNDGEFATKRYVDDTAFSGAGVINASATAKGVVEAATQLETASSTPTGSTGAVVVIPASNATSTYNAPTAALRVPVTRNDGYLDPNFIAPYRPPVGSITAYSSTTAPLGWLLANGQAVSRTTYADLFAVIGTSYGVGDGSTTFNLPDLTGRTIVMASSTQIATSTTDGTANNRATIGYKGGETMHTQTVNELAAHNHPVTYSSSGGSNGPAFTTSKSPSGMTSAAGLWETTNTGNNVPANVLDPYIVMNYIIKY